MKQLGYCAHPLFNRGNSSQVGGREKVNSSPIPLLRWLIRPEQVQMVSHPEWLSDRIWVVRERFTFSSGRAIERTMFVEIVEEQRLHVTADDMPMGADIILQEQGFVFTPYRILAEYFGKQWSVHCVDENTIDASGVIQDTIRVYWMGIPVATMQFEVRADRSDASCGQAMRASAP